MLINNGSITVQETLTSKKLKSCRKLNVYLHAKNQLHLTSFLRYYKDIANLLFWELWESLTIPIKIIASICSKLSYLSTCKKSTSITSFFLKMQRNRKLIILGNLGIPGHRHLKLYYQFEETFHVYLQAKINSILHVFLETLQR